MNNIINYLFLKINLYVNSKKYYYFISIFELSRMLKAFPQLLILFKFSA